jgi:hypothetical protein
MVKRFALERNESGKQEGRKFSELGPFPFLLSCVPDSSAFPAAEAVINFTRWQMIAGEQQCAPEESPNTIRQHAA